MPADGCSLAGGHPALVLVPQHPPFCGLESPGCAGARRVRIGCRCSDRNRRPGGSGHVRRRIYTQGWAKQLSAGQNRRFCQLCNWQGRVAEVLKSAVARPLQELRLLEALKQAEGLQKARRGVSLTRCSVFFALGLEAEAGQSIAADWCHSRSVFEAALSGQSR